MGADTIRLSPVTGSLGALVTGVDLRQPLDSGSAQLLRDALNEHLVLFFRNQDVSPNEFLDFALNFGDLQPSKAAATVEPVPGVSTDLLAARVRNRSDYHKIEGISVEHPVVRVHPETGRKALFVNYVYTQSIVGLPEPESRYLISFLLEHIKDPSFQVRFKWEPHSIALWDERSTQHCVVADYASRRVMHRCMTAGDRPIGP